MTTNLPAIAGLVEREAKPSTTEPPRDDLVAELTKDQRKILRYLWQHPQSPLSDLHANVWAPRVVEDATFSEP